MAELHLDHHGPELRPVRRNPWLATVNGCGARVYGCRDVDAETGTYVCTHFITLIYLPILALGAYRVADAPEGGWHFFTKEPLTNRVRLWNLVVIVALASAIGLIGWSQYTGTAPYQAKQHLAQAQEHAQAGRVAAAAAAYRLVIESGTEHAPAGVSGLGDLLAGAAQTGNADEAAQAVQTAVKLHQRIGAQPVPRLFDSAVALAAHFGPTNPRAALLIMDAVEPIAPTDQDLTPLRLPLLKKLAADSPGDIGIVSQLALAYERSGALELCEQVLQPLTERLADSEGARILGNIYARRGQYDRAYALLQPYTQNRLTKLHEAQTKYEKAYESAAQGVLSLMRAGKASDFDYEQWDRSSQAEQGAIVDAYIAKRLQSNRYLEGLEQAAIEQAGVVPAALELGIVMLNQAQSMQDAQARRQRLESAEQVLLSIRSFAGQTDEYRMFLGKVYYWLGKHEEGQAQFDALLKAKNNQFDYVLAVANALRNVGAQSLARQMTEKAYNGASDEQQKYAAASTRALLAIDTDDEIQWLQRSDPNALYTRASLASAGGSKAALAGDTSLAERFMREAIDIYASAPESSQTLNNAAVVYLKLFETTGDRQAFHKAAQMLERAVALLPDDSVLTLNAARTELASAVMDVVGDRIDLRLLKRGGDMELLRYLYADETSRRAVAEQLRGNVQTAKALSLFDKGMLMAPKKAGPYAEAAIVYNMWRDTEAMRRLLAHATANPLDIDFAAAATKRFLAGEQDQTIKQENDTVRAQLRSVLAELSSQRDGVTFAVAASMLVESRLTADLIGEQIDLDATVTLAEQAFQTARSSGTRGALVAALLTRAHHALAQSQPRYAELTAPYQRAMAAPHRVALALVGPADVAQLVGANADVKRVAEITAEDNARYPGRRSPWEWAMLHARSADDVAAAAQDVRQDEQGALTQTLTFTVAPFSAANAVEMAWLLRIQGKMDEARAVLKRCASFGTPVPLEP